MVFNRGKKLKIICSLIILFTIALMSLGGASHSPVQADELLQSQEAPIAADSSDSLDDTGDITITLEAGQYEIKQIDEYSVIEMEGFGSILNPGEPKLPSKTFLIGLPPGAEAVSVDLVNQNYEEIPGEYRILPAPPIVSGQEGEKVKWGENEGIYSSESAYPSSAYEYLGMGQMRKYSFARVRFSPIVYYPATGKLGLYHSVTLRIRYEISQVLSPELLSDTVMDDVASQIITNYPSIKSKYQSAVAPLAVSYNYVIITTDSLQSAVQPLVTWKTAIGYSVNVVTTSWISTNYSGRDLPEKIRNFLIDKYISWEIKYVLIVGSHSTIPMRDCYPDPSDHDPNSDSTTPTDYYYADLTGNWDSDGDGFFGEYGQDSISLLPEVYVGRIPFDDSAIVTSICQKSVAFEQNSGVWKKKALLLAAIANYVEEDHQWISRTDDATLMQECWNDILSGNGYSRERMYEKEGLSPSTYACEHPLTNSNVLDPSYGWPSGYGIVNWGAHGSQTAAYREVWATDDGDKVAESAEMAWPVFIRNSDTSSLDNSKPAIVFSDSCLNAYPEYAGNLGNSLLQRGAVAFVGATRPVWYVAGWSNENSGASSSIDYYFFHYLINQSQNCGDALYNAQVRVYDYYWFPSWEDWQNMFAFCLYGDPSLGTATIASNNPPNTPSNPFPANHATGVSINADLGWTGGDPDAGDTVTYDVYFGTSSTPPLVSNDQSGTTYDPGTLAYNTKYYWKIIATDNHGASTTGSLWDFTTQAPTNNLPNTPSSPSPANHATGVSINADLSWTGGDPDAGDTVTYDVYFGTSATPPLVSNDQSATTYDPGTLSYNTKYYWKVVATDNHGASTTGPIWDFTTQAPTNNPPNTPSNPSPANHATAVSINADLSWTGGDPDAGDTMTYDVYFGTSSSPPLVSNDQSATTYDPGTLIYNTKYYWKVVATDNHGASTAGPLWDFTTQVPVDITWNCPLGDQPLVAPNPGKGRPYLSVAADCAGITASAGAALWGIYYLVETGPSAGTWKWSVPGFASSTLTQLEPGEYYWVVVSAPCTLTIPQ